MSLASIKSIAETLCLLAVALSAGFFAWDSHQTQVALRASIAPVGATVAGLNQTIDLVNQPCNSVDAKGHLLPDGPICELDTAIHDIRKITTVSQQQVQQTGALVTATAHTLTTVGLSVQQTATALSGTATAATGTLQEGQRTLAAFQPVLGHADAAVADLDAALKADAGPFNATLVNVQNITGSTARITNDAERVADDATEKYFKPEPWYKKAVPALTVGAKIAAYALPW